MRSDCRDTYEVKSKGGFTIYAGPCIAMHCVESACHDTRIEPRSILAFFHVELRCDAF